jgi:hypothetical protein
MTDPIAPSPAQPAIPSEEPMGPSTAPDINPGGVPIEDPVFDPSPADPGDWRPRDG